MHFFTSITSNYIPKARVLAASVKHHNPGAGFSLVLADRLPENWNSAHEPFDEVLFPEDLDIENLDTWVFKHSVVELCTAVKGPAFLKLFQISGADKMIYLDPDILVLSNLDELSGILDNHDIALTPHQVVPEVDQEAIIDNEICSLKHGIYNLGFLAVRRSDEGMRFLKWWTHRLLEFCYDDIPNGLFTDQRWVDLAPAFFSDVFIIRDKTYNVATWNLSHRDVRSNQDGSLVIDGSPVKFFHFSSVDSGDQKVRLKKYADKNSPLFKLRKWYIQQINREGQNDIGRLPCVYSYYSNGERITDLQRRVYRSRQDLVEAFPHPSRVTNGKKCYYRWFKEEFQEREIPLYSIAGPSHEMLDHLIRVFRRHPTLNYAIRSVLNMTARASSKIKR